MAVVGGVIFAFIAFFKNKTTISDEWSVSNVYYVIIDVWNNLNAIQRIIIVISGLFMSSGLFQLCFSWNKGVSAFYGGIFFLNADRIILIGTDAFYPMIGTEGTGDDNDVSGV